MLVLHRVLHGDAEAPLVTDSTLDAITEDLVSDSFVFRYDPEDGADDGLPGREGSFSLCSFWYVECLTRARLDEARLVFEKMLGYANHLGLYSEEIGQWRGARQLPAGVHASRADLGRLRPRPRARQIAAPRAQPSTTAARPTARLPARLRRARLLALLGQALARTIQVENVVKEPSSAVPESRNVARGAGAVQQTEQEGAEPVDDEDPERELARPAALNRDIEKEAQARTRAAHERDRHPQEQAARQNARPLRSSARTAEAVTSPAAMLPRP
jgi:hypothetical protein